MDFLHTNVVSMRAQLTEMGNMLTERGILEDNGAGGGGGGSVHGGRQHPRPETAPVRDERGGGSIGASTSQTLLVMDNEEVGSEQVMLKFILGNVAPQQVASTAENNSSSSSSSRNSNGNGNGNGNGPQQTVSISSDINDLNVLPLRVEGWDKVRKRRIKNVLLSALDVDGLCGFAPRELSTLTEGDRRGRLRKVLNVLGLRRMEDELEEWEEAEEVEVEESEEEGEEEEEEEDGEEIIEEEEEEEWCDGDSDSDPSPQKPCPKRKSKTSKTRRTKLVLRIVSRTERLKR